MIRSEAFRSEHAGSGKRMVTFAVPAEEGGGAVSVVGDFNGWDPMTSPLQRHDGWLRASVVVDPGRRYAFRYLAEGGRWFNDAEVGTYEPNGMGQENAVLDLTAAGAISGDPDDRLDLHNSSVATDMATAHLCGTLDLRTGRMCIKPVHHRGSCELLPKSAALEATGVAGDLTP